MQTSYFDPLTETLDREAIWPLQREKLQKMLSQLLKTNAFYQRKLAAVGVKCPEDVRTLEDYRQLPLTTKEELSAFIKKKVDEALEQHAATRVNRRTPLPGSNPSAK